MIDMHFWTFLYQLISLELTEQITNMQTAEPEIQGCYSKVYENITSVYYVNSRSQ